MTNKHEQQKKEKTDINDGRTTKINHFYKTSKGQHSQKKTKEEQHQHFQHSIQSQKEVRRINSTNF
jgi:hypothetical protein